MALIYLTGVISTVNVNTTFWQNYTFIQFSPTYSHKHLKPNWMWKFQNITENIYSRFCELTLLSQWKWSRGDKETFSRVTARVLAVGSVLTFNPGWVTGMCWCAEEGQEGTLLPRPLRSHVGNSWAAPDSRKRRRLHRLTFRGTDSLIGKHIL